MRLQQQMPPPVPPPNFVPPPPTTHAVPKSNGLMTARSTSHHESMSHAIITSTSFLNNINPITSMNNQNGGSKGPTSTSLPHLQQVSPPPISTSQNELPQHHGKAFNGVHTNSSHSENGVHSNFPIAAPRSGSGGMSLPPSAGAINLNSAKSVPNITTSRSNSNASGAAISPVSGGEGSCNSSSSPGGGLGYPPSNPPGSVCSSTNASTGNGGRPRPQPIAGTPPPEVMDRCDAKLVQQTCNLFGLDMVSQLQKYW